MYTIQVFGEIYMCLSLSFSPSLSLSLPLTFSLFLSFSLSLYIHIYIYMYIYVQTPELNRESGDSLTNHLIRSGGESGDSLRSFSTF